MARDAREADRSLRSVFVGNIPYDATEEKLKEVFSEVGPVLNFRLVYDRETGKPKGYGFCEYRDMETAMSAMRNLNNHELNGRNLRVDNAANERTREEFRNLQTTSEKASPSSFENPRGPEVDPEKAPEAISQAVASLPAEQMFELAKQMKQCIQTNPTEARNMLLQNPQLSYALLQALVVMRAVDPQVALSILYRSNQPVEVTQENVPPPAQMMPQPMLTQQQQQFQDFPRHVPPVQQLPIMAPPVAVDPRAQSRQQPGPSYGHADPRSRAMPPVAQVRDPRMNAAMAPVVGQPSPSVIAEQEKAALIMQVLQLSDHEINMLPAEQRQHILLLKDQIARGNT